MTLNRSGKLLQKDGICYGTLDIAEPQVEVETNSSLVA
jgi:hypothetical protein